jgi:3'-phosphoadenosine 5'-phosphosulfate sulfotransferase (PAPS reductase)/FAD synthetase
VKRVSFSGGADSTALAIYLRDQGAEVELVFADTGAELPETLWFVPTTAHQLGCKLRVVSGPTFFQQVAAFGYLLPSWRVRWCTRELKTNVLPEGLAVGICADEDHRMPNAYRPLVDAGITKAEARQMCESRGLLNPVYKWRTSCSCFCCPFQRKADWLNLWREHPDLYRVAEGWEQLSMAASGFTWNDSMSLEQLRTADTDQLKLWKDCREQACVICTA